MRSIKPRILLTLGDPSGIGPEVILKALAKRSVQKLGAFSIIGSRLALEAIGHRIRCGLPKGVFLIRTGSLQKPFRFGVIRRQNGLESLDSLSKAISLLKGRQADLLVTGPIQKESLRRAGAPWEGHTELLRDLTKSRWTEMAFVGERLRLILVTRHLPFRDIPRALNRFRILQAILRMHAMLHVYFDIAKPKLALCGLNPHAGEGGLFGKEEKRLLKPAVRAARRLGIVIEGPVSPDAVFYKAYHGGCDGIVALYHDQGLIPFKMVERDIGVNVTLGLPFIRTSPDHGTAFDIAGKGLADPSAMVASIELACRMWSRSRGRKFPNLS